MKIVLYNTKSDTYRGAFQKLEYYPTRKDEWDHLAERYSEHELILLTQLPGTYLLDLNNGEPELSEKIKYIFMEGTEDVGQIVERIQSLKPDIAIAITTPSGPLDWNAIKDGLIAESLEQQGIRAYSHKVYPSMAFFDKWRSNMMLRHLGFGVADALYVHNELFWAEKKNDRVRNNVYREYILERIKNLKYPVIIKDTVGCGSRAIEIAEDMEHVAEILMADSNISDVIIEEMLPGEQFGTEIHGSKGHYHVLPPFALSTNEQGITDAFQNVKFGPIRNEKYSITELQEKLRKMAEACEFTGSVQVDLVFNNGEWYVIEINPRWSGMTTLAAAAQGRSPYEIFIESALAGDIDYSNWDNLSYAVNFKIPTLSEEEFQQICKRPHVRYAMESVGTNPNSTSMYCEIVLGGFDTKEALLEEMREMQRLFPNAVSPLALKHVEDLSKLA